MADSQISSLPQVENLQNGQPNIEDEDLFVLEHTIDGQKKACKVSGEQVTKFISRNVLTYDAVIVSPTAAGGADYDPDTGSLTLQLPRGPGIKRVDAPSNPGQPGATDTYTLIGEDHVSYDPDYHIEPGGPVGTFSVYNGKDGLGTVNSVMGVQPTGTDILKSSLMNIIYPVGSVYISTVLINPDTIFGGTWERIEDTFLMAAGTNHAAGTTHTNDESVSLSKSQLPNEQINVGFRIINASKGSSGMQSAISGGRGIDPALYKSNASCGNSQTHDDIVSWKYGDADGDASASLITDSINGGVTQQALDIAPTYLTVYMWKRTALAT